MGWLGRLFRSSSSGRDKKGKRGRRSANPSSNDDVQVEEDVQQEVVGEQEVIASEASAPLAEPVDIERSEDDGHGAPDVDESEQIPETPVTTEDVELAKVLMLSGDFIASVETGLNRALEALQQQREAQTTRGGSQSVFAQGESIMEEAIRSVESAVKAYELGFAANSEANTEASAKVREMAVALSTRKTRNQLAYQGVLRQALEMKEKATEDLAAALDSLNSAVINVDLEVEESAKAAATADATKESASEQLLAVQALWIELATLRQELLARPETEPGLEVPPEAVEPLKPPADQSVTTQLEEPYILRRELTAEAADLLVPGLSGQAIEDQVLDAAALDARAEKVDQPVASPSVDPRVVPAPVAPEVESLTGDPALDLEIANAQAAADFPGSAGASAAEALRREMAGLSPLPSDGRPDSKTEDLLSEQEKQQEQAKEVEPEAATPEFTQIDSFPSDSDPQAVQSLTSPVEPTSEPKPDDPGQAVEEEAGLARSYRGRIYLMFDASLSQEILELVWDAVEEVAGAGVIVDTRLVSREEGVQMTLDLGGARLDVTEFIQRLPGAELEPLAADRLRVAWPATVSRQR